MPVMYTYKIHRTRQREEAKFDAYTYIFGGDCIPTGVEGVTTYPPASVVRGSLSSGSRK